MKTYRARVEETRYTYFEFNEEEIEGEDDPETAAFELAQALPEREWEIGDVWVEVDEVDDDEL